MPLTSFPKSLLTSLLIVNHLKYPPDNHKMLCAVIAEHNALLFLLLLLLVVRRPFLSLLIRRSAANIAQHAVQQEAVHNALKQRRNGDGAPLL